MSDLFRPHQKLDLIQTLALGLTATLSVGLIPTPHVGLIELLRHEHKEKVANHYYI